MVEAAPSSTARLGIVKRQPPGSSEKLREGASAMVQLLAIRKSCVLLRRESLLPRQYQWPQNWQHGVKVRIPKQIDRDVTG